VSGSILLLASRSRSALPKSSPFTLANMPFAARL
jgi:hypothetical protein